ncbi:MAG: ABC transporter ATP-binding protein/permease [Deltaproteobacteria bacterium]|jgi:ATP-binding cassette subfamily B protein|nr:ABC transporter ATP-binding protein/permease [Deltaproteobacteria bacterium]
MQGKSPLAILMPLAAPFKWSLVVATILSVLGSLCGLVPYLAVGAMIKDIVEANRGTLVELLCIAALGLVLEVVLGFLSTSLSHRAAFGILEKLRLKIAEKLLKMPQGLVDEKSSGQYKTILVDTVEKIEIPLAHLIPELTASVVTPLLAFFALFYLDWRLGLASIITLPVGGLSYYMMTRDYQKKFTRVRTTNQKMNSRIVEFVTGLEVIKTFGGKGYSLERLSWGVKNARDALLSWAKDTSFWYSVGRTVAPATLTFLIPFGIYLFHVGTLDAGTFITALLLTLGTVPPLIAGLDYTDSLAMAGANLREIDEILSAPEELRPEKSLEMKGLKVEWRDVSFAYKKGEEALSNINLVLEEGTMTALVGPSGGGKTTILKLMAGFYEPDKGEITIGGLSTKDISLADHRRLISYVFQDNYLFNISILENIRLGRGDAALSDIYAAAKSAAADDFILAFPEAYDTLAGEGGARLSGGQRQRIAIARAILKNSPIVVLDEATAFVDSGNEKLIYKSLNKLVKEKTVLVVAHRLSSIMGADRIHVLDKGQIIATGTHGELLEKSPLYRELWDAQFMPKGGAS